MVDTTKEKYKRVTPFSSIKMVSRTGNSGAFAETQTFHIPICGVLVSQLPDGAGGGGGLLTHPGMAGGMRA